MAEKKSRKKSAGSRNKSFFTKIFAIFKKRQNFGLLMMIFSLAAFFCMSQMKIQGFHWFGLGVSKLNLGLNLQEGIVALIFILLLESKGIYDSNFFDKKKVNIGLIFSFIINFAIFTSFFSILIDPKESSFFGFIGDIITTYGFVFGILLGIWFFGTRTIATLAPVVIIIFFVVRAWSNLQVVSKTTGILGWLYFVFMVVGFVLQHNFNMQKALKEIIYLFGFSHSKFIEISDTVDSVVETSKRIKTGKQSGEIAKIEKKQPANPDLDATIVG